jgi:four helix bundle protein
MITRFEQLEAWQMARQLTKQIYFAVAESKLQRDFRFRDQICAASLSIGSNIAEGFERGSKKEFVHFLMIAKGSCAEVRSQLYSALDIGYLTEEKFKDLIGYAERVGQIIGGLRVSILKKIKN